MRKGILILTDWPQDGVDFFQLHVLTKQPSGMFARGKCLWTRHLPTNTSLI